MSYDNDTYLSPFTWRYGSEAMRVIWSETHKRRLMRRVWIALATAQHKAGLVTSDQLADLERHKRDIDIERARAIERETRHDVVAELRTFAEQCSTGGGIIHWGATSTDITDNVDALRMREALRLLKERLERMLNPLAGQIGETARLPVLAYTHIQPAEPTTMGYRLAFYAQALLEDLAAIRILEKKIRGKGIKGAVGTQASFQEMLKGTNVSVQEMESDAMEVLGLPYYAISGQTYPRRQDLDVLNTLAVMASTMHKFALDFRILQSAAIGEWTEPFGNKQTGSSAMPFKRNPILSENICSLARYVAALTPVAWDNASQSILERSLDDSANRRMILPEAFLATEELLIKGNNLISGMEINREKMARNLRLFGPFAATERVLSALVSAGADRQEAYEWLREATMAARTQVEADERNPLVDILTSDGRVGQYLSEEEIRGLLAIETYLGTAASKALEIAERIKTQVKQPE